MPIDIEQQYLIIEQINNEIKLTEKFLEFDFNEEIDFSILSFVLA